MRTATLGIGAFAAGLGALASCALPEGDAWYDQLEADSPCYRVDLADGLDEASTAEVQDLFACLDHHGHLASMRPSAAALDLPARDGDAAGIALARAVNEMDELDLDPFALAGVALDLLEAEDRPVDEVLDLALEAIYGVRAGRVRSGLDLTDPEALERGLLAPLAPVLPRAAGALLDDDLQAAEWAGDLLASPEARRWVLTADALARSPREDVRVHTVLPHLGDALLAMRSPGNDLWPDASGDSLKDVVRAFTLGVKGGPPVLDAIAPETAAILGDSATRTLLQSKVVALEDDGTLARATEQLTWLVSVDTEGDPIGPGELSAFARLARMLHATNRPMRCEIDLGFTTLEPDLGNLAVTILETIAEQDPDTVQSGLSIVSTVLGWSLTDPVLELVAESGVCPALTREVVADLHAVDVLYDERAYDVLVAFVEVLDALKRGEDSRIPDFADLASDLHATGAIPPVEEALRDTGRQPLVLDLVALAPVLADPGRFGLAAGPERAADLQDVLSALLWVVEADGGRTGWDRMRPLVQAIVVEPGTWEAVANLGTLLDDEASQAARALELLPRLVDADPELTLLAELGPLLGHRPVARPLLRAVETEGVVDGLLAARPRGQDPEVPLAFAARLVVNGAVDDLLHVVDLVLGSLDG